MVVPYWKRFAGMSRLLLVSENEDRQPQFFTDAARYAATDSKLDQLEKFFDRHMRIEDPSKYASWSRALANYYEIELANSNMLVVIAIWTYMIDPGKETPI
ncbi:hypothetical protein Tcan_10107 [Toxocara canis]|uniref:Uncharacterized protein n=2 Tax=Toxocara canis TaxID=6265 RepID=A0A0B2VQ19_TOXCA|nr:hypothetical protein Tcan_10107 [Toxocara canis]VDM29938.1 unnamed protein product [Toxocara canis]